MARWEQCLDDNQAVNALVRRCVAGDAAAWQEIVQQYNRRIYNICYRFSGSPDDAADLTQEVFIKVYRTLSTFDGTRAAFMTWVTTVTRNLLVDHFRKGKYDRVTDSLEATPGGQEDGLTVGEQLEDQSASPEAGCAEPADPENGARGTAEAVSRTAGSSDFTGLTGHGLQGNRPGIKGAGGNGKKPD